MRTVPHRESSFSVAHHAYDHAARAFDSIATTFDDTFENEITSRLRRRLYQVIESVVPSSGSIVDINCGTGIDLRYLAGQGYRIRGIDISPKMVSITKNKLQQNGLRSDDIAVSSFSSLSPSVVPVSDLAYSNFGGLNCIPDLESTARAVASVVRPGGFFIGVLMPPVSLWECVSFAARGRWKQALRRFRKTAPATGFGADSFPVYYHSVGSATKAFSVYFKRMRVIGLSIVTPTPQSIHFERSYPLLARFLVTLDGMLEEIPLLRACGDHYILVMQKKP